MLMVRLSDLSTVVAEAHGIPEPTVVQIARHLREAGLLTQAGRGLSAAQMTAGDAANLLIAVNAAPVAKEASQVVAWYRSMVSASPPLNLKTLGESAAERRFLRDIAFVADTRATFGDALEGLLVMAAEGKLREFLHNLGLLHLAREPKPYELNLLGASEAQERRKRILAALADESGQSLVPLRKEFAAELDNLIRTGRACVLARFGRPYPRTRIEVRRGGENHWGQPENGVRLINTVFQLDFDDDTILAQENYFHELRYTARSELITIDQRALLAVGEALFR
jgi:DNA-binding Lrp family transcriptional regulator